jgi:DNA-binding FadR family transcriptional regulator
MTAPTLRNQLSAVDTSSFVDKAEMQLLETFVKRGLKTGDRIPKETELASAWEYAVR